MSIESFTPVARDGVVGWGLNTIKTLICSGLCVWHGGSKNCGDALVEGVFHIFFLSIAIIPSGWYTPVMSRATIPIEGEGVSSRVQVSAEKLKRHIQACRLQPGDRYISAEDAGQLLGESVTTAQRAMALLARHKILERRPKAGTFIGAAVVSSDDLTCLHFLLPEQCIRDQGSQQTLWHHVEGMRTVLPNLSVQFNFVPHQDVAFAKQVIERAGDTLSGVVLVLSSRPMRAFFNQSGIPTVVGGGVEPDLSNLCWVTADQVQIGQLLASHLLERGHRRIATIMRDVWSVGEHQLHDGVGEVMAEAGLATNALLVRSAPVEHTATLELARSLLQEPNPPTGFICRTELQADCAVEAAKQAGVADAVDVVVCSEPVATDKLRYTSAVSEMNSVEMGKTIGRMFRDMAQNKPPEPRGHRVPVKLHVVK